MIILKNKLLTSFKLSVTLITLIFINSVANSATFTAITSGNWSNTSTWGGTAPTFTSTTDQITIPTGLTVTMDNNVTLNGALALITVNGTLTAGMGNTMTIASGAIAGTGTLVTDDLIFGAGASLLFTGSLNTNTLDNSTMSLLAAANIMVNQSLILNNGVFNIQTGGTLGLMSGTNITLTGGSLLVGGGSLLLGSTYNVIYSGATVTGGLELSGSGLHDVTINMPSTNTLTLISDLTVTGTLTMSSGRINLAGHNLNITGNLSSSGTGTIVSTAASNISISTATGIAGTLRFASSAQVNNFTINVGAGNNAAIGGVLNVNGAFSLTSGTLYLNTADLSLTGSITSTTNGNIHANASSNLTIQTTSSTSGGISFVAGGDTLNNLSINIGAGGNTSLNSNLVVKGTFDLQAGHLYINNNALTIDASGTMLGGSASSYVVTGTSGLLGMQVLTGGSPSVFHIGTAAHYFPASIFLVAGSSTGIMSAGVRPHVYASGTSGTELTLTEHMVDATWFILSSAPSGLNMNLELQWNAAAEVNSFTRTEAYVSHYTGGTWDVMSSDTANTVGAGYYSMTRTNITSLSPFAVFEKNASTGIDEINANAALLMYPNPFNNDLNFKLNNLSLVNNSELKIYDVMGKEMSSTPITEATMTMSTSDFPAGLYFYKVISNHVTN